MRLLAILPLAAFVLAGCARSTSVTEIRADGSWQRKLSLVITKQEGLSDKKPVISDVFTVPKGPEWKVGQTESDAEIVYTATRDLKLGDVLGDIGILSKGKVVLTNEVSVKEVDGRYVYHETFTWKGEKPKDFDKPIPALMKALGEALPASVTTAEKESVAIGLQTEIYRALLGPGDPILLQLLLQPDFAERKLRQRLGKAVLSLFEVKLRDKLSADQRREAAQKIMRLDQIKDVFDPKDKASPDEKSDTMVTMAMIVKMPGAIISSNGEIDTITNEVFWSMLPEAAAIGPVTLEAISEKK